MTITAERRQIDIIDRLAAEAKRLVSGELGTSAEMFVRRYFTNVAPEDVIYTAFDTLLGGVLSLWNFGMKRTPGKPKVRLFNPTDAVDGWDLQHTVIEIVNDDMPFLVDSVTAEIRRRERQIHLLLHPVVQVRRGAGGNLVEVTEKPSPDGIAESYMHVEIDQETEPAELEAIRASLEEIFEEVALAVRDWPEMRARLTADIAEIQAGKLPMPAEEVTEGKAFLQWLDDGNFIFLGHRRYTFDTRDGRDYLRPAPETGLGILSSMRPESVERGNRPLSEEFSQYARRKDLIIITKINSRSRIHRSEALDRIGIKRYDDAGNLIGEDRFLGLFTSAAYKRSVRDIPMLRLKAKRVRDRAGLKPHSHDDKSLVDILEDFPRDEFFQITDTDLYEIARGILLLQERQRVALFTRADVFGRFVACYVFVPRERFTEEFKEKTKTILEDAFQGTVTEVHEHITESALARGVFTVRTSGPIPDVDVDRIEAIIGNESRTWSDRLRDALTSSEGEETGIDRHRRYRKAFPMAYAEGYSEDAALYDIRHVEQVLATGELVVDLFRHRGDFHCKIIHAGPPVPLSEIMPRLENMGLKVLREVPYELQPHGASQLVRIRDFTLASEGMPEDLTAVKEKFESAFIRVWKREAENDGFNRLVLGAELEWHEVVILRAYAKYLRQVGVAHSQTNIQQTLARHSEITRYLIQLFVNYFDPALGD